MFVIPMHLVRRPDTRSTLRADSLAGPWRWEGQALPLEVRARVLEALGRRQVLEGTGAPDLALDGGDEVVLDPKRELAALCTALLSLGGTCGVVVVWAEVQGLPVKAAA